MPELPEVETVIRALRPSLVGQQVIDVTTEWPRHIVTPSLALFKQQIKEKTVAGLGRRGKYILIHLDDGASLIVHLRMSGHLAVVSGTEPRHKHDRTIFQLANRQELRFRDQRKFGRIYWTLDIDDIVGHLGPEPLTAAFTPSLLQQRLHNRKRAMKSLLLDQTFIAGVGNIYADEALFYARIHPEQKANTLKTADINALHQAIQKVLKTGIEREGASIDLYTKPDGSKGNMQNAVAVFRRTDQPCYTCGTPIRRTVLGGRSTHYCPTCQKSKD